MQFNTDEPKATLNGEVFNFVEWYGRKTSDNSV